MMHLKIIGLALAAAVVAVLPAHADTKEIYDYYCAQCHGITGQGDGVNITKAFPVKPRSFANAKEMEQLTDAELRNAILKGGPGVGKSPYMPPWDKTLNEADVEALIGYLRKLCSCTGKSG